MKRIPTGIDIALGFNPDLSGSFIATLSANTTYDGSFEVRALRCLSYPASGEIGLLVNGYREVDFTEEPPQPVPGGWLNVQYDVWLSIPTNEPDVRPLLPTMCSRASIIREAVEEIEEIIQEVGYIDNEDLPKTAVLRLLAYYWVTINAFKEAGQMSVTQLDCTREKLQRFLMMNMCLPFST
jgi:hypothetical protein